MTIQVLIIEDDFRIANIHKEMIEQLPFCTVLHTALNAKEAMTFLENSTSLPDIMLVDVYIPDVKGLALIEQLRTNYPYSNVIIASAANDATTVQAAKRLGVFDFLLKPIDQKRLQNSFERFHQAITWQNEEWSQQQLDQLFHAQSLSDKIVPQNETVLPKGIDQLTLDKILSILPSMEGDFITAQQLTKEMGISRSTARRYLEYLDAIHMVEATLHYGQVGRPQRMYIVREQYEQN